MKKIYVLSGTNGSGKSTVLKILRKRGYPVIEEQARKVIAEQHQKPAGIHRTHPDFQTFLAQKQRELENQLPNKICFLDRSVVDGIVYSELSGLDVTSKLLRIIKKSDYEKEVFFFEVPPKEKYGKEGVTFCTYEEALKIHEMLLDSYKKFGYSIITVKFDIFQEQADFIENKVNELHWVE